MKENTTFETILSNLSNLLASQIRAEIEAVRTHGEKQSDWVLREKYVGFANGAENYFYLILNPQDCTPENVEHAKKHGYPIP